MTVRAKFQVVEIAEVWNKAARKIVLEPRYDTSIPEDQRFAQATPSGRFEMTVDNPSAVAALPIGKQFYIDISPVPEETPAESLANA